MSLWGNDEEHEDGDDDEELEELKDVKDKILFLVDCRKEMFESNDHGEIHWNNCIKLIIEVMKSKIIASDNASVGLIFFGTVTFYNISKPIIDTFLS
jgi:hypothetical protein